MAELFQLNPHTRMSVQDVLGLVERESPKEILVLFINENGDFAVRSSAMSRKDALWLCELGKDHALNGTAD